MSHSISEPQFCFALCVFLYPWNDTLQISVEIIGVDARVPISTVFYIYCVHIQYKLQSVLSIFLAAMNVLLLHFFKQTDKYKKNEINNN